MSDFAKNKLVVISGGSQGLGKEMARVFVEKGSDVVVVSRTESKLKQVVTELENYRIADSQKISYIAADVADPVQSDRVFAQELGGVPDIVVCCAGGATPGLFVDIPTDQLAHNMRLVYDTALYFSHAALKVMGPQGSQDRIKRHLVFCSSVLAVFPFIGYSSYGPGKAAIRALADILRQECIPYNISVSNVLPGNMQTEGFEEEERTKPQITKIIEGPSAAKDPRAVALQVIRDLEKGHQMVYTDFVGWALSGLALGTSPRNLNFFQTLVGILLVIFSPIWSLIMNNDIKKYFNSKKP